MLTSACATIIQRDQILQFDSKHRGLEIYSKQDGIENRLGITPFVKEIPRKKNLEFTYGRQRSHLQLECNYRYFTAFGNIFAFASVPLMIPIALATDYLTEKAWSCNTQVWIDNTPESTNRRKTCHRYFILPPHETSRIDAFIRLEEWMRQVKDDFSECSSFVETDKILRIHGEFHLGIHKKFLYRKIRRFTKLKIAEMTNADVIVVLNKTKAVDNSSTKFITAEFYDIHNDKKLTPKELGLEELPKVAVERDSKNIQDIWDLLFQFELPNTILVGSSITRFSAVSSSNQTESSSEKHSRYQRDSSEFARQNYSTYPLYSSVKPSLDLGFSFSIFRKTSNSRQGVFCSEGIYGTYGPKRIHTDFGFTACTSGLVQH